MPFKMNEAEARPTLPSIHTLNLPLLASPTSSNVKYQNHDNLVGFFALHPNQKVAHHLLSFSGGLLHTRPIINLFMTAKCPHPRLTRARHEIPPRRRVIRKRPLHRQNSAWCPALWRLQTPLSSSLRLGRPTSLTHPTTSPEQVNPKASSAWAPSP